MREASVVDADFQLDDTSLAVWSWSAYLSISLDW